MIDNRCLLYAIFAALSAGFVGIFAKIEMEGIDSIVATTVRAVIMLAFLIIVCTEQKLWGELPKIPTTINWTGIVLIAFGAYLASLPRTSPGALDGNCLLY